MSDKHGWIKVEDGLPETDDDVLVTVYEPGYDHDKEVAFWTGGVWYDSNGEKILITPTHWQPLPEKPEDG